MERLIYKALSKMSSNEIVTLINALGTGSKDFNLENLRYDKIVIMTDADSRRFSHKNVIF